MTNSFGEPKSSLISLRSFPILIFLSSFFTETTKNKPTMENPPPRCKFPVILFDFSLFFCLISFVLCIVAELQRNKQDDLRWSGRLCHAPLSPSYGLGIAALACLALAQLLGNFIFFKHSSGCRANVQFKIPVSAKVLILISWLSCVFAIQVLMIAISMSREQKYGRGWLNGECYLVKGGIFVGSAILALVSVGSMTASTFSTMKCAQTLQNRKAYS